MFYLNIHEAAFKTAMLILFQEFQLVSMYPPSYSIFEFGSPRHVIKKIRAVRYVQMFLSNLHGNTYTFASCFNFRKVISLRFQLFITRHVLKLRRPSKSQWELLKGASYFFYFYLE